MEIRHDKHEWIKQHEQRTTIIQALHQPMTASQLADVSGIAEAICAHVLRAMQKQDIVTCLNPTARRSRVFGLTTEGRTIRKGMLELHSQDYIAPVIDWDLYGFLCYAHRTAVILALDGAMRPADIKRRILFTQEGVCISCNNIRDLLKELLNYGVVEREIVGKSPFYSYRLTPEGEVYQRMLLRVQP
ncbi:MAG: hypothetical protein COA73_18485 [Candidatus Hydrogenedentota bacterium]|nr:MAG: hypothetical protein COA73_18485 [Candidatus Hydrogenedentota bacterium]